MEMVVIRIWVPAFAGMRKERAGMTKERAAMTKGKRINNKQWQENQTMKENYPG